MSLVLGPGETAIREEEGVVYHTGHSRYGSPMWGKLILTNKRFMFVQQRTVETGRIRKQQHLETVGIRMNLPNDKVLGANQDSRERKTGTFSKERYGVLIVSLDTDRGVENPLFEVRDPQGWSGAIQKAMGGEAMPASAGSGARFCKYCGKPLGTGSLFCPQCGKSQT